MEAKTLSENTNKLWLMPILSVIAVFMGIGTGSDLLALLGSGAGIATIVPVFVEFLKAKVWNFSGLKFWKYPVSRWFTWAISFVLCYVAYELGTIQKFSLTYGIFYAILTGLAANRYFHWSDIEFLLALATGREDKVATIKALREAEKKIVSKAA
jgi:hypothetical protein